MSYDAPPQATAEMMARMMTPSRSTEMRTSRYKVMTPKQLHMKVAQKSKQPKRNAPCPCGSGLKFKKCCIKRKELVGL